ncbi:hypothetical protein GHT06_017111 [Daphnia sinensis]|uniref:Uncharacterized protein n=1 Tax=Daphnia sinensis TaxID=1820382 RepID=A0AAD5KPE5_9CRUS|nr:hypothetical protein GHT06_017111 [Daphnia sinensis]
MEYMERNWIRGKFWTLDNWSCFNVFTRTNNDCEGMPHQWNKMTMVLRKLAEENKGCKKTLVKPGYGRYLGLGPDYLNLQKPQ